MPPFFSICIPQYNRTSFLLRACEQLQRQTFKEFEVCIADDRSTDGRSLELSRWLAQSGLKTKYYCQPTNKGYDGNLRTAIEMATGAYCLLMGNDDQLAEVTTLQEIFDHIKEMASVGVCITNYLSCADGTVYRRVGPGSKVSSGVKSAIRRFRNFSFVSGVVLNRERAQAHSTEEWDGAEMYQMYLGSRILAEGYSLIEIDTVAVHMGIQIPGESVDSYAKRTKVWPCPIKERRIPLTEMGRLVIDAVAPYAKDSRGFRSLILLQLVCITYPFWLVEYRRVQSWRFAVGIALGMRPKNVGSGCNLGYGERSVLSAAYLCVTAVGLLIPIHWFQWMRPKLYHLAKALGRRSA